jgi:putative ABC transport system permease protein
LDDARKLHGSDIFIRSYDPISPSLAETVINLRSQKKVDLSRTYEFFSVVRSVQETASVLSRLKVVAQNYPLYGEVVLQSGRSLHTVLRSGRIVVEKNLLDRLGLQVGDQLRIGFAILRIEDIVLSESDRPVNLFAFGPRIFVSQEDKDKLGLIRQGSRIRHSWLLKVADEDQLETLAAQLKSVAAQERVETYRSARSRVKRFLDNFLFFLKLVGLFILIIAGAGIQGTLGALLREKQATIAIMKTVGARNRYIATHFMLMAALLGLAGIAGGLLSGFGLQMVLAHAMGEFLPPGTLLNVSWSSLGEGILLGAAVVFVFTYLPLYRLSGVRPVMILRQDRMVIEKRWPLVMTVALFLLLSIIIVAWHLSDLKFGIIFVLGFAGLVLISLLFAQLLVMVLKRLHIRIKQLALRQAIKGLFRRGNAVTPIVVTLSTSLCVIFSVYLIERNLDATFVHSYPADNPNLFCIDIQPQQQEEFRALVQQEIDFYPIVRARLAAINDVPIDREKERTKRGDNLARVFNLTYREHLLTDEVVLQGDFMFNKDRQKAQVSVLDSVAEMQSMKIGDALTFKIQGVPLRAVISSIRSRTSESLRPFFYFVFPTTVLAQAPQTGFAALTVDQTQVADLQNKIVSQMPNISVIDLSTTIKAFAKLMKRLSSIVRLFSLLSIASGLLILTSAIFATRAERIVESVYYTILGAKKIFVERVFAIENGIIALLATAIATLLAQTGAFLVCRLVFEISFQPFMLSVLALAAAAVALVVLVGFLASRSIVNKKPVIHLREQTNG